MTSSDQLGPPYGPPANLHTIFAAWRDRGMPATVDRAWFVKIGLSGNLATRNLHALRYLGLVDDHGCPSERAERLRIAPTQAYHATLAATVRIAYAKAFALCDPAHEPRARVEDAFRHEAPAAQRARMVACFLGLCAQAGIVNDTPAGGRHRKLERTPAQRPADRPLGATEAPAPVPSPPAATLEFLLAKFPDFDPAWSDGIKEKWFDAFARLRDDLRR